MSGTRLTKQIGAIRGRLSLQNLTADITLTAEDSGKVFLLDAVGEDIIIPAAALGNRGVWYKFIVNVKVITSSWTVTSAGSADMHGVVRAGGTGEANTISAGTGQDKYTITHTVADEGDGITIFSTGLYWMVTGQSHAAANILDAT